MRQKGFSGTGTNDGNNKSFKMLPERAPSGCKPMPWGYVHVLLCGAFMVGGKSRSHDQDGHHTHTWINPVKVFFSGTKWKKW